MIFRKEKSVKMDIRVFFLNDNNKRLYSHAKKKRGEERERERE